MQWETCKLRTLKMLKERRVIMQILKEWRIEIGSIINRLEWDKHTQLYWYYSFIRPSIPNKETVICCHTFHLGYASLHQGKKSSGLMKTSMVCSSIGNKELFQYQHGQTSGKIPTNIYSQPRTSQSQLFEF